MHQYSWRERLQNQLRPVLSVRRSASSSIHESWSTLPVPCSWTMAGTRPSALNATWLRSCSLIPIGVAVGMNPWYGGYR